MCCCRACATKGVLLLGQLVLSLQGGLTFGGVLLLGRGLTFGGGFHLLCRNFPAAFAVFPSKHAVVLVGVWEWAKAVVGWFCLVVCLNVNR